MAKVVFTAPVDMAALDIANWFGVEADIINTSSTSMTFDSGDEVVVVNGTGFNYIAGVPFTGTVTSFTGSGVVDVEVTQLNITIPTILGVLDNGSTAAEDMINLFFGGADGMFGSTGSDVLFGFGGKDGIRGGKGNDFLHGGAGRDALSGGIGKDTFSFSNGDSRNTNPDLISDLNNVDFLDFSSLNIVRGDISVTYDAGADLTTFAIDHKGTAAVDMTIVAYGDHTDFNHFIVG